MRRSAQIPTCKKVLAFTVPVLALAAFPAVSSADMSIRIGLGTAADPVVMLAAPGGLDVIDTDTGAPVWRGHFEGSVRVVLLGSSTGRAVFRIQVGSFRSEDGARDLAARLERDTGTETRIHHDPDRRVFRVRVGAFADRLAAGELLARMNEMGFDDAWITEEFDGEGSHARLRLVDADYAEQVVDARALTFTAPGNRLIRLGGRRYRGKIEVFIDRAGRLRPVNVLPLEAYLRGVVPEEMGPTVYPEVEALKAQAVAARTYAARNRDQFVADGYDLCDTPRCQVYGGADSEHPLTDQAVRETRGEILTYGGVLVNAMFTSTCGGHTEDVENVFPEQAEPYLRGVTCAPEARRLESTVIRLAGSDVLTHWRMSPALAVAAARLVVLGIVDRSFLDQQVVEIPLTDRQRFVWLTRLGSLLGKDTATLPEPDAGRIVTRGALARDLVSLLGWGERLERLMPPADRAVVVGLAASADLPLASTTTGAVELALMVRDGIFDPEMESDMPWNMPVGAFEGLMAVARLVGRYGNPDLDEIRVRGFLHGHLITGAGDLDVAADPFLFAEVPGGERDRLSPVRSLPLTLADPVRVHLDVHGRVDYVEAVRTFRGLSDDRFSRLSTWEERRLRRDLSDRLRRSLSIGRLNDLHVVSRGVSGRVSEMEFSGTRGVARLKGFRIRTALDLKETLFTIDRQRSPEGQIVAFTFSGRGWGHGLGLCQVGAYGMAVRGATYREILGHYYTGVEISQLVGPGRFLDSR
ncbi:MAG: SpoIID/LytB domain-containing protein [Acidobacteriota bacterium]